MQVLHGVSLVILPVQSAPPSDAPVVDTAEQVYISSLALLKVNNMSFFSLLLPQSGVKQWSTRVARALEHNDFFMEICGTRI